MSRDVSQGDDLGAVKSYKNAKTFLVFHGFQPVSLATVVNCDALFSPFECVCALPLFFSHGSYSSQSGCDVLLSLNAAAFFFFSFHFFRLLQTHLLASLRLPSFHLNSYHPHHPFIPLTVHTPHLLLSFPQRLHLTLQALVIFIIFVHFTETPRTPHTDNPDE